MFSRQRKIWSNGAYLVRVEPRHNATEYTNSRHEGALDHEVSLVTSSSSHTLLNDARTMSTSPQPGLKCVYSSGEKIPNMSLSSCTGSP